MFPFTPINALVRCALSVSLVCSLAACNIESALDESQQTSTTLTGSVGDGPIIDATVTVYDAEGQPIAVVLSDVTANYTVEIPEEAVYPLTVVATGGTDMVTGAPPTFELVSVTTSSAMTTININPYTTLMVKAAEEMDGGLTDENLEAINQALLESFGFGLNSDLVPNSMTTLIDEDNIAAIIKSSEALSETIRRTRNALLTAGDSVTADEIIEAFAADLVDGVLDGLGAEAASARTGATANIVAAQVLIEALANRLTVEGAAAESLMDAAIIQSIPSATMMTADVVITDEVIWQAQTAVAAVEAFAPSSSVSAVAVVLAGLSGNSLAAQIDEVLPPDSGSAMIEAIELVVLAGESEWALINETVRLSHSPIEAEPDPIPEPAPEPAPEPQPEPAPEPIPVPEPQPEPEPAPEPEPEPMPQPEPAPAPEPAPEPTPAPTPEPEPDVIPGTFEFAVADYVVGESDGGIDIVINRVNGSDGEVTVDFGTLGITAVAHEDYQGFGATPNPVTFVDGEVSRTITIPILPDTLDEADETFEVHLKEPTGGSLLGEAMTTVVTIVDDDESAPAPAPVPAPGAAAFPAEEVYSGTTGIDAPMPDYLTPVIEPTIGLKATRVTDTDVFGIANVRHSYAKTQPWNADGSLIKLAGWPSPILDGETYELINWLTPTGGHHVWSNTDPNTLYGESGNVVYKVDARTGAFTALREFPEYDSLEFGPWEANISNDDRYMALAGQSGNDMVLIVYDLQNDDIVATRRFAGKWGQFDWVSMSQSGEYVVVNWVYPVGGLFLGAVESYDRNLNLLAELSPQGEHGDIGYDVDGNEVYVQVNPITAYRLDTGEPTVVLSGSPYWGHISCRNLNRPGWCYASVTASKEVFAIKLDGSETVQMFSYTQMESSSLSSLAVPSPDGTKVLFRSDWGGQGTHVYISEMP